MNKYIFSEVLSDYNPKDKAQTADLKRVLTKLRNSQKILVTRRYEPYAITFQQEHKLVGRVLNMYDYFQDTINVPTVDLHIRLSDTFDKSMVKIQGIDNNRSDIYQDGQKIAEVAIAPMTNQLIGRITWFDCGGIMRSSDFYDRRGFKSSTQYYHLDGSLGHEVLFDAQGTPKMEIISMAINGVNQTTGYKLLNYQGADYLFASEQEVWDFFKKELLEAN